MKNVIDINQFLAHEYCQSIQLPIDQLIGGIYHILSQKTWGMLAQSIIQKRFGFYCMVSLKGQLIIFVNKQDKTYLFEYVLDKNMLHMNQRRAQSNEITWFMHYLNQMAQCVTLVSHLMGQSSNTTSQQVPEGIDEQWLLRYKHVLSIQPPIDWQLGSQQKIDEISHYLNKLSSHFKSASTKKSSQDQLAGLINICTQLIQDQELSGDDCVLITNETVVNAALNNVYAMMLTVETLMFTYSSNQDHTKILIDCRLGTATMNDDSLNENAIMWLLQRFTSVQQDLINGRAEVFEAA